MVGEPSLIGIDCSDEAVVCLVSWTLECSPVDVVLDEWYLGTDGWYGPVLLALGFEACRLILWHASLWLVNCWFELLFSECAENRFNIQCALPEFPNL